MDRWQVAGSFSARIRAREHPFFKEGWLCQLLQVAGFRKAQSPGTIGGIGDIGVARAELSRIVPEVNLVLRKRFLVA
jgi:hypothetical protein